MTDAATIAHAFNGKHIGGGSWLIRCPLPTHGKGKGDRNPSVKVSDDPRKEDGIDLVCFAGCDWRDLKAELVRRDLLVPLDPTQEKPCNRCHKPIAFKKDGERWRTVDPNGQWHICAGAAPIERKVPPPIEPDPEALAIWRKATPTKDTKAESYLRARGITIEPPPSIRFLTDLVYGEHLHLPAMVAAVQAADRKILSVQATWLDPRGDRKAQVSMPRKTTGPLGDGAVRLAKHGSVLGLAEGTETGLSAMQLFNVPCWSTLGCKRLGSGAVKLPVDVDEVHIFGDNDKPGREAAEKAADVYNRQGRRVLLRFPPEQFNDWNDALQHRSIA